MRSQWSQYTTRRATCFVCSTSKVLFGGDSTWMGDQIRIPRVEITFFSFFPFHFQGDIEESRTAILVYCRLFLFINFLFLILRWPYIFVLCLYHRNKQRDRSLEFSSILATVDLSKHLIMVESFVQKFIQLVNFVTFRSSFPFLAIEYG